MMQKLTELLIFAMAWSIASTSWSQQAALDVGTVSGQPGATVSVPIDLSTDQSIAALQFDLTYAPSLVTPTGATIGGAATNHLIASAVVSGHYRVVIYSPTNAPLASARLANVTFTIAAGASAQSVPIGIQSVVLSSAAAVSIPTTTLDPGSITVLPPAVPSLTISTTQTSGANPATLAGQTLGYSIVVTNTGTLGQTGVSVTGTLPNGNAAVLTGPVESGATNGILDIAETWTYATSYTVTQDNMDAGTALVNTARVVTAQVPGPTQAIATTPISQSPALTIVKTQTSGPNPVTAANQVLGYTIVITNTGNVSQTTINVTDTLPNGTPGVLPSPVQSITNNAILEVGETWTYTISYTVTQANYLAGVSLVNTARVSTTQVLGPTTATATTPIAQSPSLTIVKTQTSGPNPATAAAQVLGYTIVVTNTGNVVQTGVNVTDTLPDGNAGVLTGPTESVTPNGVLDTAETWTYSGNYTVTQANMNAGTALVNTARVVTAQVPGPTEAIANTTITQSPALTISKTQTSGPNPASVAGQVLGYNIVITNTGNVIQTGVNASDTLPNGGAGVLPAPIQSITTNSILEVGETWTYTLSYTVTQADIDIAAALVNTARVVTTQVPGPTENTATTQIAPPLIFANGYEGNGTAAWSFAESLSNLLVDVQPGTDAGTGTLLSGIAEDGSEAFRIELREGSQGMQVRASVAAGLVPWGSRWVPISRGDALQLNWWSERPPGASNGGLRLWANGELLIDIKGTQNAGVRLSGLRGIGPDGVASDPLANGQLQTLRILEVVQ